MKIIKRGTPDHERAARVSCRLCKSDLEVEKGECKHHSDIRGENWYEVICPVCSNTITIAPSLFTTPAKL